MLVEVEITIGDKRLKITDDVTSHGQLFSSLEFYDSIPREGPNGETDLKFVHRVHKGYDFYEVVCPSAKQRFTFGQRKEPKGWLFPKGWEPMYGEEGQRDELDGAEPVQSGPPVANPGQVKAINQLVEDITKLNVRREAIFEKIHKAVGRIATVEELTEAEASQMITLLRNRLAEIKTQRQQQKAGVA